MACCRAFGVAILALSLGAGATRHEHPAAFLGVRGAQELRVGMVPSAISRAIQHALRDSRAHLKALTTAEKDAAEKKATADSALAKKVALEEDKRKQEEACEEEEKKSRENRMKLEKASEEHDLHSEALDKARGLWNKLSDELEFLRKGVKQQEKTLMETLYDMETALDAKKKEVEEKESETAAAELDMKEKEDKAKAAGKVKKEYEEQLIEAERRSKQAQEALQAIRAKAEEAVDEVIKAEMEQKEAASQQKEAQALHDKGAQSSELLQKLKAAVEDFFNAIDALEASMMKKMSAQGNAKAHELILLDENLEPTLSKYNLMVVAFDDVWTYGDGSYAKVEPAIEQIVEDAKADLELICDPTRQFGESMAESPELEEKCWTALWRKVGMSEGTFPGENGQLPRSADVKTSNEMPTDNSEIIQSPKAKGAATLAASEESTPAIESAKALDMYMETTATSTTMGDIADLLAEDSITPESPAKIMEASSSTTTTTEDVADPLAEDSLSPAKTMEVSAETHTSTTPEVEDDLLAQNSITPESPAKIMEASSTTTTTIEDVADLLAEDSLSPAKTMEVSAETHTSTTPEVVHDLLAENSITPESPAKIMEASTETHATSTTTTLGDLSDLLAEDSSTPKSPPKTMESSDISDLLAEDSITPKSPAKAMGASTDETHATSTTTTLGDLSDLLAEDSISSPKKEIMGSDSPHSPHWMEHITSHFMPSPSGTATAGSMSMGQ